MPGPDPLLAAGLTSPSFPPGQPRARKDLPLAGRRPRLLRHRRGRPRLSNEASRRRRPAPLPSTPAALSATKATAFLGTPYTLRGTCEGPPAGRPLRGRALPVRRPAVRRSSRRRKARSCLSPPEKTTYSHRVTAPPPAAPEPTERGSSRGGLTPPRPSTMPGRPGRRSSPSRPGGLPLPRLEVTVRNTGTSDFLGFFNTAQSVPFFIIERDGHLAPGRRDPDLLPPVLRRADGQAGSLRGTPHPQLGRPDGHDRLPAGCRRPEDHGPAAGRTRSPRRRAPLILEGRACRSTTSAFAPTAVGQDPADVPIDIRNPGTSRSTSSRTPCPTRGSRSPTRRATAAWNASPIPPGATRGVRLRVQRIRGSRGRLLPALHLPDAPDDRRQDDEAPLSRTARLPLAGPCRGPCRVLPARRA